MKADDYQLYTLFCHSCHTYYYVWENVRLHQTSFGALILINHVFA